MLRPRWQTWSSTCRLAASGSKCRSSGATAAPGRQILACSGSVVSRSRSRLTTRRRRASPYVLKAEDDGYAIFEGTPAAGYRLAPAAPTLLRPHHRRRHPVLEDRPAAPRLVRQHSRSDLLLLGQRRPMQVLRDRRLLGLGSDHRQEEPGAAGRGGRGSQGARRRRRRDADNRELQRGRPGRPIRRPMRTCGQGRDRPAGRGSVRAADGSSRSSTRWPTWASTRSASTSSRSTQPSSPTSHRPRLGPESSAYFRAWERAVDRFGEGQVSTYVILGMGEDPELTVQGCRRAIDMGVFPFVVPIRPVAGSLMEDVKPPDRAYTERIYRRVGAYMAERGMDTNAAEGRLCALPGLLRTAGCPAAPADRPAPGADLPCRLS